MTVEEALAHPYLSKFSNASEEIVLDKIITIPMNENIKYSIKEYRESLYKNIIDHKKVIRK